MAIDAGIGLGDLIGGLFAGGAGDAAAAGAADLGAAAATDLGAADLAGGAVADLGAGADLSVLGGDAAAAGAAAGPAVGSTIAGLGAGAGDLSVLGGDAAAADFASGALPGLGDFVGGSGADALANAPDIGGGLTTTTSQAGSAAQPVQAAMATGNSADTAASAAGGTVSPTTELSADPNIQAQLGIGDQGGANLTQGAAGPSTSQFATAANNPAAFGSTLDLSQPGATGASGIGNVDPATANALASAGSSGAGGSGGALSSITSGAASVLNNPATKLAELGLPAGMLAYNLIKGPAPIPPQAQQAEANAEAQLGPLQGKAQQNVDLYNQTAAQDLNLANQFKISPAQAASINQWQQAQYNQLIQQIANQQPGVDYRNTSEWVQGKNQIDQQALAQQVQMVNQLISTAFSSASAANAAVSTASGVTSALDQTLMAAAQLQVQQDTNFQNAVGSALQGFGLIAGLGSFGKANAANTNAAPAAAA